MMGALSEINEKKPSSAAMRLRFISFKMEISSDSNINASLITKNLKETVLCDDDVLEAMQRIIIIIFLISVCAIHAKTTNFSLSPGFSKLFRIRRRTSQDYSAGRSAP